MKYSEFLQLREILESQGITINEAIKHPNLLLKEIGNKNKTAVNVANKDTDIKLTDIKDKVDANTAAAKDTTAARGTNSTEDTANNANTRIETTPEVENFAKDNTDIGKLRSDIKEMPADQTELRNALRAQPAQQASGGDSKAATDTKDKVDANTADAKDTPAPDTPAPDTPAPEGDGGGASMAAIPNLIMGIKATTLLTGAAGVGVVALIAWLFKRQIISLVWVQKLKNNAKNTQKSIAQIIAKHGKDLITKRDQIIKKQSEVDNQLQQMQEIDKKRENVKAKSTALKTGKEAPKNQAKESVIAVLDNILNEMLNEDENTIKRLNSVKQQLDKASLQWEEKFVSTIENAIDSIMDGKTKEISMRVDDLKQLKPGQKMALKNLWNTMMINLKAEVWKIFINSKIISNDQVKKNIQGDIDEQSKKLKNETSQLKVDLEKKYQTRDITIGDKPVKLDEWYLYKKSEESNHEKNNYKGDVFIKFNPNLEAENLKDGKESYVADAIKIDYNEKTGSLIAKKAGRFAKESELIDIIKKANGGEGIAADTKTYNLEEMRKNTHKTKEQKQTGAEIAKRIKATTEANKKKVITAFKKLKDVEEKEGENSEKANALRTKIVNSPIAKSIGITALTVTATAILKSLL